MSGRNPDAAPKAHFSVGAALGYAWVIFRARPVSFVRLLVLQAVIYSVIGFLTIWLMGRAGMNLGAPAAEQTAILLQTSALTTGLSLASVPLWVWIEAMWLDVFQNRAPRLWPGWGDYGRLLLSFIIVMAIFIAAYLGFALLAGFLISIAAVLGGVGPGVVTALAVLAGFILFLVLVQTRLTALPALTFARRSVAFGEAWRLAGDRLGALGLAWFVFLLLYLAAMLVSFVLMAAFGLDFAAAFQTAMEQPDNPLAQYAVYSPVAADAGAALAALGIMTLANLIYAPLLAISRGIGVRFALEADEA